MRLYTPIPVWVSFVVAGLIFAVLSTISPEQVLGKHAEKSCPAAYFVQGGVKCPSKPASS